MATIEIQGEHGPYTVYIGKGIMQLELPVFIEENHYQSVVVVTNTTVNELFGYEVQELIPKCKMIVLPDGEEYKNLATVHDIYLQLLEHGADRRTLLVTLGGGVIGDMAGFAAATFMRGIDFVQVPTTLLAMVDASVGGKVGVNLPVGKNLVGAFHDPQAVFADTNALKVLMRENNLHYSFGMAEVIKHGLLADPWLLDYPQNEGTPEEMVRRAIQVKTDVVEQDRLEHGIRAHLNLGHTFAHAIERVSNYDVPHGQAVGIGLAAAAHLSVVLGLADDDLVQEVVNRLEGWNLMYRNYWNPEDLWNAMQHDKKWQDGRSRFVLLEGIGQPTIVEDVPARTVTNVLFDMMPDVGA